MHVQSCSFANLNLLHFWRSRCRCRCRCRRRRRCLSSPVMCRDPANCCVKHTGARGKRRFLFLPPPYFPDHARPILPWSCFRDVPAIWDPGAGCKKDDIAVIQKDQVRISAPYFFKKSTTSIYEMENVFCNLFTQHARISFLCKRKYTFSFSTF